MTIRFLLDNNVDDAVADFLRSRGHEALLTRELFSPKAPDQLLMVTADIDGLVVVSHDKDFGNLASLFPPGYRGRFERGAGRLLLNVRETQSVHRLQTEMELIELYYDIAVKQRKRFLVTISNTGVQVTTNSPQT
jgi:hypothetical protein